MSDEKFSSQEKRIDKLGKKIWGIFAAIALIAVNILAVCGAGKLAKPLRTVFILV